MQNETNETYKYFVSTKSKKDCEETSVYGLNVKNNKWEEITTGRPFPSEQERLADSGFVQEIVRSLTGEILTIIDASFPEGVQKKSVKDLIRKAFMEKHGFISQWMNNQSAIDAMVDEYIEENGIPESVSLEEAIGM